MKCARFLGGWGGLFLCTLVLAEATLAQTAAPVGVTVETVTSEDMSLPVRFPGTMAAAMKVVLTAGASGILEPARVANGALVKKGDLLFTLDKSLYQAQIGQAQAQLEAARVNVNVAQAQFDRTADLVNKGVLPKSQYQTDLAALDVAKSSVKVQQAAVVIAQLNLAGTDVRAPFDGRIGQALLSEGAHVGQGSGQLATLVSLDPIRVRFYIRQRALLEARSKYGDKIADLVLTLMLADGSVYDQKGKLLFTDVEAIASTDSVAVVGEIANPSSHLLDGQLVTVLLGSTEPDMQIAVSQAAVMLDQTGSFVLTVDKDNKVQEARVTLAARKAGRITVASGLQAGDKVIVAGIQKVSPGMVVAPQEQLTTIAESRP